ncbi:type III-B CRISPR module RAMP protein Cmr6 [Stenoxybacter acetivorans]|uniref:type III-B CRISPR module RAMP protein Cmr6 n=1 Tax=Stenoxybacter acetivorans TaxID=422441 RepID=UPI00068EC3A0|nr:type III-B CRISPR module RAMP protein Cmr6 [Stenoxybacter acetivorans]
MTAEKITARRIDIPKSHEEPENIGLLLNRYLEKLNDPESKENLFNLLTKKPKDAYFKLYEEAFNARIRQSESVHHFFCARTLPNNRLIIGLGNPSALETGLTLQHTYGTPMIPGSALKGICAHHARELFFKLENNKYQPLDDSFTEDHYTFLFGGGSDANPQARQSKGAVIFHDAWICPDSLKTAFHLDVMTPHHTEYYSGEGDPPTDFNTPIPIPFLSITGCFQVKLSFIGNSKADGNGWIKTAAVILKSALKNNGIGGKTSSGYGRMDLTEISK